jgi:hypothetical protein
LKEAPEDDKDNSESNPEKNASIRFDLFLWWWHDLFLFQRYFNMFFINC